MGFRPILLILVLAGGFLPGLRIYFVSAAFEPHAPIRIDGNGAFTQPNGVTGGSGTASDPYIVQGWDIDTDASANGLGIGITNTTAFLVLRDIRIHSVSGSGSGIALYNVTNSRIVHMTVSKSYYGIVAQRSSHIEVLKSEMSQNQVFLRSSNHVTISENNMMSADIKLLGSSDITLTGNFLTNTEVFALVSRNVDITNNTIVGHSVGVSSSDPAGIVVGYSADNLTVKGNVISGQGNGILLTSDPSSVSGHSNIGVTISNITIFSNYIENNQDAGIRMRNVARARIEGNDVSGNYKGIDVDLSHDITISNNLVAQNGVGVDLGKPGQVTVSGNTFLSDGLVVGYNRTLLDSYTITPDNTVNGKPLYFYKNCGSKVEFEGVEVGQLIMVNCKGIRLSNLHFRDTDLPVQLSQVQDVSISQSQFSNNAGSLSIAFADNVTIAETSFSSSRTFASNDIRGYAGIPIIFSHNISIVRSRIGPLASAGLVIFNSTTISVLRNDISRNEWGLEIERVSRAMVKGNNVASNDYYGLGVGSSRNITLTENTFSSNGREGIRVGGISTNVTIADNDVSSNAGMAPLPGYPLACGIVAPASLNNNITVRHNNVLDNTVQACDFDSMNWDSGYPAGGNYWSDYTGKDNCSGPLQDICPSPDGIGETPYVVDSDSQDRYPSTMPFVRANSPPVAFFSPPQLWKGYPGTVFNLSASQSWDLTDSTGSLEARWDWEDDGIPDTDWSAAKVALHQYSAPGVYTIRLEVKDLGGLVDFVTRQVLVLADTIPPSWRASSALASTGVGNTIVNLNWSLATDNVAVASYRIYQGDTLVATLPGDAQTYTVSALKPGTAYMFRVEAGDVADNWTSDGPSLTVTTSQPGPVPAAPQPSSWDNWFLLLVGAVVLVSALLAVRVRRVRSRIIS